MSEKEILIDIREDYLLNGTVNAEHYNYLTENYPQLMVDSSVFIKKLDEIIEEL